MDILDLTPRVNPSTNKTYGSNAAANWGYQFRAGFLDGRPREVVTIYEILRDEEGELLWAVPDYQFQCAPPPVLFCATFVQTACTTLHHCNFMHQEQ